MVFDSEDIGVDEEFKQFRTQGDVQGVHKEDTNHHLPPNTCPLLPKKKLSEIPYSCPKKKKIKEQDSTQQTKRKVYLLSGIDDTKEMIDRSLISKVYSHSSDSCLG